MKLAVPGLRHAHRRLRPRPARTATSMALVQLKNSGALDPATLDHTATKVTLLAAQPAGRGVSKEIYREKGGRTVEVLTSSEASNEECSMSAADVWVISKATGRQVAPATSEPRRASQPTELNSS